MKNEYKETFDKIKVSEELKKQTENKLSEFAEKKRQSSVKSKFKQFFSSKTRTVFVSLSTAAVLLFCAVIIPLSLLNKAKDHNLGQTGNGNQYYTKSDSTTQNERKISYSVSFSIIVDNYYEIIDFIKDNVNDDIWIASLNYNKSYAQFNVRVKTSKINEYEKSITDKVSKDSIFSYNKNASDLTLQYYNAETKIDMLNSELAMLNELYQRENTSIQDLFLIAQRCSQVESELQRINAEINGYDSQLEYSIFYITVRQKTFPYIAVILGFIAAAIAGVIIFFIVRAYVKKSRLKRTFS